VEYWKDDCHDVRRNLWLNGARYNATRCSRTGLLHRHSSLYFQLNLWIDCNDFTYSPR
jgi:hypothetical protein